MQPVIKEVSKDDSDLSPDDIIVDPKTHHTYRKGRLIGKGGFAKVYEVSRICAGEPMAADSEALADKIIDKEVFSRRSTSKDKVKREILLHKDLIHPNIVRFHNFFSDGKSLFYYYYYFHTNAWAIEHMLRMHHITWFMKHRTKWVKRKFVKSNVIYTC